MEEIDKELRAQLNTSGQQSAKEKKVVTKQHRFPLTSEIVEGFAASCLTKFFDNASQFEDFHREWWQYCTNDKEPFLAICAPRGHSKSTTITIVYTLAAILFRNRSFVVIVADTESQASLFLNQIKTILYDSEEIRHLFGLRLNDQQEVVFQKDTETDFILEFADGHVARVMAKGAEQKLRGLLFNGKRPDLILIDDLLNEELVANKDRRDKLRRWVYGSLIPARSQDGIIRMVGTPMNLDDPLESLMPSPSSKDTVDEDLKVWSRKKKGAWVAVKYRAHNDDYSKLLWPSRRTAEDFKATRSDYVEQGIPEVYACEFLCNPIDDSIRYFKKNDLVGMQEQDYKSHQTFYVTCDLAISLKDRADYTAIVVGGMDESGVLHVRHVIRERMDGEEIVNTILALQKTYNPVAVGIEDTQISKSLGPFLNRVMMERNIYPTIIPLKPHRTDKISRARSIQARCRAAAVKVDKKAAWYQTFEDEVLTFPRAKHDDIVDAFSYLGLMVDKMIEAPTVQEFEEEEYQDEVHSAGYDEETRNSTTGY